MCISYAVFTRKICIADKNTNRSKIYTLINIRISKTNPCMIHAPLNNLIQIFLQWRLCKFSLKVSKDASSISEFPGITTRQVLLHICARAMWSPISEKWSAYQTRIETMSQLFLKWNAHLTFPNNIRLHGS